MADDLLMQTSYVLVILAGALGGEAEATGIKANRLPSGRPIITATLGPTSTSTLRMACAALGPGVEPVRLRVPARDGTRGMAAWMLELELPNSTVILSGRLTDDPTG